MIFETHAHYDDERFEEDREELLASLPENGIQSVINCGASVRSSHATVELAKRYPQVYAAVGVHPSELEGADETFLDWMRMQARWEKTVAIGEIGLDYYWEKDEEVRAKQRDWFGKQLDLAGEVGLPVIIHSRDAAEDTLRVMKEHEAEKIPGVIHCYSYSPELAKEFVKMGYYIGIGGVVTFKNARKLVETVASLPAERILLETDCPYMAPEPYRGKRNSSLYLPYVVEKIAEIRGMTTEAVEEVTMANARRLFAKANPAGEAGRKK